MNRTAQAEPMDSGVKPILEPSGEFAGGRPAANAEVANYLPHLSRMSRQLRETSQQIETSVVGVCNSFQGIAERAKEAVTQTASFLTSENHDSSGKLSFESLIGKCGGTMVKILNATEEASEISRRAIEQIRQMDCASQSISAALAKLERIAKENKILAMNARIEAAHAGEQGAGFAVVAVEVVSQTEKSQKITAQVNKLITSLRTLARSTLEDLQRMNEQDHKRVKECRLEVDESLEDMRETHGEMKKVLSGMTDAGMLLADDIGSAVRGLQFQDRTSQQIAHVVEDLDTLHEKLTERFGRPPEDGAALLNGFAAFTMQEERRIAGIGGVELAAGDVELF